VSENEPLKATKGEREKSDEHEILKGEEALLRINKRKGEL